jgi:hypothetical protein
MERIQKSQEPTRPKTSAKQSPDANPPEQANAPGARGGPLNSGQVLALQRSVGNRAVQRVLAPVTSAPAGTVQRHITTGAQDALGRLPGEFPSILSKIVVSGGLTNRINAEAATGIGDAAMVMAGSNPPMPEQSGAAGSTPEPVVTETTGL